MEFDIVDNGVRKGVRPCRTALSMAEFAAGRTLTSRRNLARRPHSGALGPALALGGAGGVPFPTIP